MTMCPASLSFLLINKIESNCEVGHKLLKNNSVAATDMPITWDL